MPLALPILPEARLDHLSAVYKEGRARGRRRLFLVAAIMLSLALASGWIAEVNFGLLGRRGAQFFDYFRRMLHLETGVHAGDWVWRDPAEWLWGLKHWLRLLGDTVLMAYVGTLIGALGGFALAMLAATNLVTNRPLRWSAKRALEFGRTVPDMVFALIFVIAFGLGPLPGVLALGIHSAGALGKQALEIVENIDHRPVEGCTAAGATWVAMIRFGVLPQILPGLLAYALLRFEMNVRGAAVLGFVGAGGIGQELIEAIRKFYYNDVAALLVLIILTVSFIDIVTSRLRQRLLDSRGGP
jgi:phosphonate transport system permease protein